jgi:hypothetical protein
MDSIDRIVRRILTGVLLALLLVSIPRASVAGSPAAACARKKLAAAASEARARIACYATPARSGGEFDNTCALRAAVRFDLAFTRAESAQGCLPGDTLSGVEHTVDACVEDLLEAASGDPAPGFRSQCLDVKLRAAARELWSKAGCTTKALSRSHPTPIDTTCGNRAELKFIFAMAKAENRGDCVATNDAQAIEAGVDECVADIIAAVPQPTTTTTTTLP